MTPAQKALQEIFLKQNEMRELDKECREIAKEAGITYVPLDLVAINDEVDNENSWEESWVSSDE